MRPPANAIELVDVAVEDPRLDRLLQLYIHEWSARLPIPIGDDARYTYPGLPAYGDGERHLAGLFLDRTCGRPLGFGLALGDDDGVWHVQEMFVIAGARGHGIGAACAGLLFARHPGRWTLTVRPEHTQALSFWRRVARAADSAADERIEVGSDGVARTRLRFVAG